jgi:hypothetical protein
MISTKILTEGADDAFRLRAFRDYTAARTQDYQDLILSISRLTEETPLDINVTVDNFHAVASDIVSNFTDLSGFDGQSYICFNRGYITKNDLFTSIVESNLISAYSLDIDNYSTTLKKPDNTTAQSDVLEIIDELKENLHSVVCLQAACEAMDIAKEDISARLSVFSAKIKEVFANEYNDISNTATYLRNSILQSNTISGFLASLKQSMNTDELSGDNTDFVVENSDFSQYAGTSPMCALATGAVKGLGIVSAVINVGAKVIANVVSGVVNFAKGLFSKATSYVNRVFVDPYDVEVIDKKADSYTVDGWCAPIQVADRTMVRRGITDWYNNEAVQKWIRNSKKWFKYSNIGIECLFKYDRAYLVDGPNNTYDLLVDGVKMYVKARSVNPDLFNPLLTPTLNVEYQGTITPTEFCNLLQLMKQNPDLYVAAPDDEKKQYDAFNCGYRLGGLILGMGLKEVENSIAGTPDAMITVLSNMCLNYSYTGNWYDWEQRSTAVTNRDFVLQLSGMKENGSSLEINPILGNNKVSADYLAKDLLKLILYAFQDQVDDPLNYSFVPYRLEKEGWSTATFKVKTDHQNADALEKFVTIATVIIIVAVVAVSAIIAIKKIARARYFSALSKRSRLDAKLWNGEKLTSSEMRVYRRSSRILERSSFISSGLQSTTSTNESFNESHFNNISTEVQEIANTIS